MDDTNNCNNAPERDTESKEIEHEEEQEEKEQEKEPEEEQEEQEEEEREEQEEQEEQDEQEEQEEKKQEKINYVGQDVGDIGTVCDILNEKSTIDIKLKELCISHMQQQQKLMQQFVANSLRLMHEFNKNIVPLHSTYKTLKQRLQNILLNEFISIPCSYLDEMAKKQQRRTWGISPSQPYITNNAICDKYMDLGINNDKMDDNNDAVLEHLSSITNITLSQQDIILDFFNTARQRQKQSEFAKAQKIQQLQREQEEKKQREQQRADGAAMLVSIFPFLSLDEAVIIMEMKSDQIDIASDYCMSTEHEQITLAINKWKEKGENGRENIMTTDRSCIDMRVLNRSQTTGESKYVIFKCIDITDDGILALQAILDRNHIPLDGATAKILYISIKEIMKYNGITIESSERVKMAKTENIVCIIFQCIDDTDFFPIQFSPKCRDLEYVLEFDEESEVNDNSLVFVKHRTDGNVLFRGIYDDGDQVGLVGDGINDPIEIYSEIIDDVTHNIICIIFENDLRDNICIDVKNISFIEQTLEEIINDSKKDFTENDAAGNKISYRIIVEDQKIIAILTKIGDEIKQIPFVEHSWLKQGELISIPSQNILGIISCIPTGLIITNNPHKNIEKKEIKYAKNINSKISKKHCVDLHGFIDIDIIPNKPNKSSTNISNDDDDDVKEDENDDTCIAALYQQSFVVTDIKQSTDTDKETYILYKQQKQKNIMNEMNDLMENIENDLNSIKNKDENDMSPKELLNRATNNVKKIQELLLCFDNDKENQLNDDENKFVKVVNENINKYNREIRALRFEVRMSS